MVGGTVGDSNGLNEGGEVDAITGWKLGKMVGDEEGFCVCGVLGIFDGTAVGLEEHPVFATPLSTKFPW